MIRPASKTPRTSTALAWGGGAAVIVAALQFLKEELDTFNLDTWPLIVTSGAIVLAGLAIGEIASARARGAANRDLTDRLDKALSCWRPRPASALTPYDVGVRPALRPEAGLAPYVERDADDDLE